MEPSNLVIANSINGYSCKKKQKDYKITRLQDAAGIDGDRVDLPSRVYN
jgi:hypothetical protein